MERCIRMDWSGSVEKTGEAGQPAPNKQNIKETVNNPIESSNSQKRTSQPHTYQRQAPMAAASQSPIYPYMQQQALQGLMQGPNQFMMGIPAGALYGGMPFNPMGMASVIQPQVQQSQQHKGTHASRAQAQTPSDPNPAHYSFQQTPGPHSGVANTFAINPNGQSYVATGGAGPISSSETPTDPRFAIPFPIPAYSGNTQRSPSMNATDESTANVDHTFEREGLNEEKYKEEEALRQPPIHNIRFQYLRKYRADQAILKVHKILNEMNTSGGKVKDPLFWKERLDVYFLPSASVRYTAKHSNDVRCFDMSASMIPLIWAKIGACGLVKIDLVAPHLRAQTLSNGCILFHSPNTTCSYHYPDGSYMTHFIQMKGIFEPGLRIKWLELCAYNFVPGVEWQSLEKVLSDKEISSRIFERLQSDDDNTTSKTHGDKNEAEVPELSSIQELRSNFSVFKGPSNVGTFEELVRFLQISDIMSALSDLIVYQKKNEMKSPIDALSSYIDVSVNGYTPHSVPNGSHDTSLRKTFSENAATTSGITKNGSRAEKQASPIYDDPITFKVASVSPGCSPRDTMKPNATERPETLKRKKSNKNAYWPARDYSGSSTPTFDCGDCGIPGTKKIKF